MHSLLINDTNKRTRTGNYELIITCLIRNSRAVKDLYRHQANVINFLFTTFI